MRSELGKRGRTGTCTTGCARRTPCRIPTEALSQPRQGLPAVLGAGSAALFEFDDVAPDGPASLNVADIDRSKNSLASSSDHLAQTSQQAIEFPTGGSRQKRRLVAGGARKKSSGRRRTSSFLHCDPHLRRRAATPPNRLASQRAYIEAAPPIGLPRHQVDSSRQRPRSSGVATARAAARLFNHLRKARRAGR